MKTRRLLSFASPLPLLLLAGACSSSDDGKKAGPPGSGLTIQEDGVYRYVLGVDHESGRFITGGAHEVVKFVEDREGKFEQYDSANDPGRLHPQLGKAEYKKYDATLTAGESEWNVFASNWWAQSQNGIAKRWTGGVQDYNDLSDTDNLSPTEKYDLMHYPGQQKQVAEIKHWDYRELLKGEAERAEKHAHAAITVAGPATKWELENHGNYQSHAHPDSWWGHCNGWASYAIAEAGGNPKRDIRVKLDSSGKLIDCDALGDTSGCLLFRMGDIEALMSELYFSDQATFSGRRCNKDPDKVERDEWGRPKDVECRDLNPGSFHIGVVGLLSRGADHFTTKQMGKIPFVIDHNWDWEVWNFPLTKYQISEQVEVSKQDAAKLVGASEYVFNDLARKFVRIKMTYWMVSDGVSDDKMLLRADQRGIALHDTELNYVLELDENDTILGGEWIKDPTTSWGKDSKNLHPDFFWMAVNHRGQGENADDLGGSNDNPFVAYSKVRALLDCANDASTCAPPAPPPLPDAGAEGGADAATPPAPNSCVAHCGGQSEDKSCWCDAQCAQYGDCCADRDAACGGGTPPPPAANPNSCQDNCGKKAPGGCWCDSGCASYGDCCSDKAQFCQ
ncbi:MAG: hypothetical protein KF718_25420 [Polyangiaceae bacterium]|nr:hypothetical protein [Polyangiaceae bacterium]